MRHGKGVHTETRVHRCQPQSYHCARQPPEAPAKLRGALLWYIRCLTPRCVWGLSGLCLISPGSKE